VPPDTQPRDFSLGDRAELEETADEVVSVILRRVLDGESAFLGLP
jgi:hypothetical protein